MNKKTALIALLLLGFGLTIANAQESANASGGEASGSGGTVSYSVGQIVYVTDEGSNGSAAQGVQQPFEISIVLGLEEVGIDLQLAAYPNPATDRLTLRADRYDNNSLSYQLFDLNGRLLLQNQIKANETSIVMLDYQFGVYLLKVLNNSKEIKTFKILKH